MTLLTGIQLFQFQWDLPEEGGSVILALPQDPLNNNNNSVSVAALFLGSSSDAGLHYVLEMATEWLKDNLSTPLSSLPMLSKISEGKSSCEALKHRIGFVGESLKDLCHQLVAYAGSCYYPPRMTDMIKPPKIAFLFTGQGSQYCQMARDLSETSDLFRSAFNKASNCFQDKFGLCIPKVIEGNEELLNSTSYSQTSIYCLEYAMMALWKGLGIQPDYVLGPSAGGFGAATASGFLSMDEGVELVGGRALLIDALPQGGMVWANASRSVVEELLAKINKSSSFWLDLAVINTHDEMVVAGPIPALEQFEGICSKSNIRTIRLLASQAFHSREIDSILDSYGRVVEDVLDRRNMAPIMTSRVGYVSGTNGHVYHHSEQFSPSYWLHHARDPVDLPSSFEALWVEGVRIFIEVGPRPVLLNDGISILGKERASQCLWLPSIRRSENNWTTLLKSVSQLYEAGFDFF